MLLRVKEKPVFGAPWNRLGNEARLANPLTTRDLLIKGHQSNALIKSRGLSNTLVPTKIYKRTVHNKEE